MYRRLQRLSKIKLMITLMITLMMMAARSQAFNDGHLATASFRDVQNIIQKKIDKYGSDKVLLALDIDNTTLGFEKDLGSEHWFLWQAQMIADGDLVHGAVANTVDGVLSVQTKIAALSPMRAIEKYIPTELGNFGASGVHMLALTSRSLSMRDTTIRELRRNGFSYEFFAPGPRGGILGLYQPLDVQNPGDAGLSAQELIDFGITSSRPVMFQEGVFLTDGQHKGAMLRTLIHKLNLRFDAIIFVDDRLKHSEAMQAAFKDRPEALTTVQYAHNVHRIAQWQASDKGEAKQDWCQFSKAILAVHEHPADADIIPCR